MKSSLWLHLLLALTCVACAGTAGTGLSTAFPLQGLDGEAGFSNQANPDRDTSNQGDDPNGDSQGNDSAADTGRSGADSLGLGNAPSFGGSIDADLNPRVDLAASVNSSLVAPQPAPNPDVGDPELYGHYQIKYLHLLQDNSSANLKDYITGHHGGDDGDGEGGER